MHFDNPPPGPNHYNHCKRFANYHNQNYPINTLVQKWSKSQNDRGRSWSTRRLDWTIIDIIISWKGNTIKICSMLSIWTYLVNFTQLIQDNTSELLRSHRKTYRWTWKCSVTFPYLIPDHQNRKYQHIPVSIYNILSYILLHNICNICYIILFHMKYRQVQYQILYL